MMDARELEMREADGNAVYDMHRSALRRGATPASSKVQKPIITTILEQGGVSSNGRLAP